MFTQLFDNTSAQLLFGLLFLWRAILTALLFSVPAWLLWNAAIPEGAVSWFQAFAALLLLSLVLRKDVPRRAKKP